MLCEKCNFENIQNLKFCGQCGNSLTRRCRSCGHDNLGNLKFCGQCGNKLGLPNNFISLKSEQRIDYTRLQDLLVAGNWKEADIETANKMVEVSGQQRRGHLKHEDFKNFPCLDLLTINQLWVHHSLGRFGFTVQKRILVECGSKSNQWDLDIWYQFSEQVGWRSLGKWLDYSNLTFDTKAREGHLPAIYHRFFGESGLSRLWGWTWKDEAFIFSLASTLESCDISIQSLSS